MIRVAVIQFPGSNCEVDTLRAVEHVGGNANIVWHKEASLGQADVVIVPGGFAYGDYLRAGAIARFSPIMKAVAAHANAGSPVLGICNGLQVLCEAGLLPGALMRNSGQRFVSRPTRLRVENASTPFTAEFQVGDEVVLPVAHGEGRYVATADTLDTLEATGRVVLRYAGVNPNGSDRDIAGIANEAGNVVGMMPHPERVVDAALGEPEGIKFFESITLGVRLS